MTEQNFRITSFNSRPSCEGRLVTLTVDDEHIVSIHAPRARGDLTLLGGLIRKAFQFTPLVRGATKNSVIPPNNSSFNSRPSCEGRHFRHFVRVLITVSIHAPRARGDLSHIMI